MCRQLLVSGQRVFLFTRKRDRKQQLVISLPRAGQERQFQNNRVPSRKRRRRHRRVNLRRFQFQDYPGSPSSHTAFRDPMTPLLVPGMTPDATIPIPATSVTAPAPSVPIPAATPSVSAAAAAAGPSVPTTGKGKPYYSWVTSSLQPTETELGEEEDTSGEQQGWGKGSGDWRVSEIGGNGKEAGARKNGDRETGDKGKLGSRTEVRKDIGFHPPSVASGVAHIASHFDWHRGRLCWVKKWGISPGLSPTNGRVWGNSRF